MTDRSSRGLTLVVSPHYDDAVLSCGELIARLDSCVVLTVFAGGPCGGIHEERWGRLTEWDRAAGFDPGDDVLAHRGREDDAALAVLGARGRRLGFMDQQYRNDGDEPSAEQIGSAIGDVLRAERPEVVILPVGLRHADHLLAAAAAALVCRSDDVGVRRWYAYLDLPYGYEAEPGLDVALSRLSQLRPTPGGPDGPDSVSSGRDYPASDSSGLHSAASDSSAPPRAASVSGDPGSAASGSKPDSGDPGSGDPGSAASVSGDPSSAASGSKPDSGDPCSGDPGSAGLQHPARAAKLAARAAKLAALACYPSQLKALGDRTSLAFGAETYWVLEPPKRNTSDGPPV